MNHNLHWHVYYTSRDVATMTWHSLDIEPLNRTIPYLLNSRFLFISIYYPDTTMIFSLSNDKTWAQLA